MDLRDGRMLIKLLEVLSGERLVSGDVISGGGASSISINYNTLILSVGAASEDV